ncbi:MAG: 2-dehydropantoate 2-reductase [Candidatus Methanomethylophilaceae archaeon]|jgi:2-dehydropantoate 2-reductase
MRYLVIGAGGTGGCIGAYMTEVGKDVTLIARGEHLKKIQSVGLKLETASKDRIISLVKVCDTAHYTEEPDVIFVCVKSYSLEETIPFIKRIAGKDTVVIPILNVYGTGRRLQEMLPDLLVTDGCIYISANIKEPGIIQIHGEIFRVVFGVRDRSEYRPVLKQIEQDLNDSGIVGILSDNIQRDTLQKFSYVSAMAACGLYYNVEAMQMQRSGEIRDMFILLVREIEALAEVTGIQFETDMVQTNLEILDNLAPSAVTSMQRDIAQGKESEIDGLIFEVIRTGRKYGLSMPTYEQVAEKFGFHVD